MQILYAKKCKLGRLPGDFGKLISLQRFESYGLTLDSANEEEPGIRFLKNLNQIRGHLEIVNAGNLSKDHAAEAELKNKKYLDELTLNMNMNTQPSPIIQENELTLYMNSQISQAIQDRLIELLEVLEVLQPPISLKALFLQNYAGVSLPSWFQPQNLPSLKSLSFESCGELQSIKLNEIPAVGGSITTFSSLNVLTVKHCDRLSTLDDLLTQEYLPAIEKIHVEDCPWLVSLPGERFVSFPCLKHLEVSVCGSLNWQRGLVLPSSLRSLCLLKCGDISPYVPSCLQNLTSLVSLNIDGLGITSIPGDIWRSNLASLEKLSISSCPDLVSIGGANAVANIKMVQIFGCPKLEEVDQINRRCGYLC